MSKHKQVLFMSLFTGYLTLVYIRQSVSFAAPVIAETEHLKNSDLGLIVSSQQLGYTFIKFVGGALADILNPGLTFTACLLLTGLTCAAFTAVSSVTYFVILWFLCGMAQGPAWSACAVLLKQNFPADQFATWWSILSTSANVAGTAGPFISQFIVSYTSWRMSLLLAATMSIGLGVVFFLFVHNSTEEHLVEESERKDKAKSFNIKALANPLLMAMCVNYLLVSVIRGACNDWGQMYLIKNKGQSLLAGSSFISSQEIGGIVGSLLTGYLSDFLITKGTKNAKSRLKIVVFLTILQSAGLYCFIFYTSPESSQFWTNIFGFCVGFGMYSSISLLGVSSMETAPPNLSGTAHTLVTLGGNCGRVLAGYPLSAVATWMSWHESFILVLLASCVSIGTSVLCVRLVPERESDIEEKTD
ncbi:glucose-6-phosphate exchanger SLC37A4-like [Physella acuta]|uniref:glucose-6-phosphate exchanger SLC37A4-like n=1 Tax=Physella acuta TaxID=109671 RepID=UPI0027DCAF09|nr:glucose-6-phosphate exchanger SLC37A4-like [Physella acuta]XP_059174177.1 glucose-6-phosphate exchanger SLC37A4-like [Physella acuta]